MVDLRWLMFVLLLFESSPFLAMRFDSSSNFQDQDLKAVDHETNESQRFWHRYHPGLRCPDTRDMSDAMSLPPSHNDPPFRRFLLEFLLKLVIRILIS